MKVYKDDRGEHDLERKIEQLQLKIRTYEELMMKVGALFLQQKLQIQMNLELHQ